MTQWPEETSQTFVTNRTQWSEETFQTFVTKMAPLFPLPDGAWWLTADIAPENAVLCAVHAVLGLCHLYVHQPHKLPCTYLQEGLAACRAGEGGVYKQVKLLYSNDAPGEHPPPPNRWSTPTTLVGLPNIYHERAYRINGPFRQKLHEQEKRRATVAALRVFNNACGDRFDEVITQNALVAQPRAKHADIRAALALSVRLEDEHMIVTVVQRTISEFLELEGLWPGCMREKRAK